MSDPINPRPPVSATFIRSAIAVGAVDEVLKVEVNLLAASNEVSRCNNMFTLILRHATESNHVSPQELYRSFQSIIEVAFSLINILQEEQLVDPTVN